MSDSEMYSANDPPRLGLLLEGIVRLAAGDLNTRIRVSEARDEIDAVIMGTNLLAEDLQIVYEELEQRVQARTQQLNEAHLAMQRMAMTDPLTGLNNRSAFATALSEAQAKSVQGNKRPGILLLDMDASKPSMIHLATPSVTKSWKRWRTVSAVRSASRTWLPAWAATSSLSCFRR